MLVRTLAAALAVLGMAATPQPALADDPQIHGAVIFEGVVTDGTFQRLQNGVLTQGALDGAAFKLTTVIDSGAAGVTQSYFSGPYASTFAEYAASPGLRSDGYNSLFTLDGVEYGLGDSYEYLFRQHVTPDSAGFIVNLARSQQTDVHFPIVNYRVETGVLSYLNPFLHGIDQLYNITYEVQPGDEGYGDFSLYYATPSFSRAYFLTGGLAVRRVTILGAQDIPQPPPSDVPEPAAWALMIAGFGLAGAALRRRTRTA